VSDVGVAEAPSVCFAHDLLGGRFVGYSEDRDLVRPTLVLDLGAAEALPVDARQECVRLVGVEFPAEHGFPVALRAAVRARLRCIRSRPGRAGRYDQCNADQCRQEERTHGEMMTPVPVRINSCER